MSLDPGARLGPYEVLAPIRAGGMGEIADRHWDRLLLQVGPAHGRRQREEERQEAPLLRL